MSVQRTTEKGNKTMKKIAMMMVLAFAAAGGLAAEAPKKDAYDIRPAARARGAAPTAVEWQNANDAALAEATAPEVLEGFVADEAAAQALLAEVKGAYASDPMKLMQVGAVTQYVMASTTHWCRRIFRFWAQTREEQRRIWATALLARARAAEDAYVKVFLLDQLRWCGYPCQAPEVSVLRASSDKAVAEMAEIVAVELARAE